jgi:hypothetical protein
MADGRGREVRAARNENVFRQINERLHLLGTIESSSEPVESDALEHFVCECFLADCSVVLELTAAEYRSVRADGTRFLIFPDASHQSPDIEIVVERHDRFWVVEKVGEAGRIADAMDNSEQSPL